MNLGGDTVTIGAVAGARFGIGGLPDLWLEVLDCAEELDALARRVHEIRDDRTSTGRDVTLNGCEPPNSITYLPIDYPSSMPEG